MGVSKYRGTPKWMVKIMENPMKMDDLGGKPTIFGNTQILKSDLGFSMFLTLPMQDPRTAGSWGLGEKKTWRTYVDTSQQRKRWAIPTRMRLEPERNEVEFFKDKGKQERVN